MAYSNSAPTIWAKELMVQRKRESVFQNVVYKGKMLGEITQKGDRLVIPGIGRPTVRDYTAGTNPITTETLSDSQQTLLIDRARYFSFIIDKIDTTQAEQDILLTQMEEARRALVDDTEDYLASFYSQCGSSVTNTAVKSNTVLSTISEALQELYENDVPANEEICLMITPAIHQKLVLAKVLYGMPNEDTIEAGFVGRVLGAKVYMSNAVVVSGGVHKCMALTKKALAFAEQIPPGNMDIIKNPETTFGTIVKALYLCGAKMIRPGDACLLDLTPAAESSTL
jgi:hypothetical protein